MTGGDEYKDQGVRLGPFDFRWENSPELTEIGLDPALITKFTPYFGLVDGKAIEALKNNSLVLGQNEYDSAVKKFKDFFDLEFKKFPDIIKNEPKVNF